MTERQLVSLHPAYLLHARPYRNTSAIAEFFTQDHGRVSVVARGARRPKSSHRGVLQPFLPVLVSWATRGSLGTLTGLEIASGEHAGLPKNLLSGYYVNELIIRAVRVGDSHQELFTRYHALLTELAVNAKEADALRLFERDLLEDLGYGLRLTIDCHGEPVRETGHYRFDVREGPVPVEVADESTDLSQRGSRTYLGETLLALHSGAVLSSRAGREAKALLRDALAFHLGQYDSKVRDVLTSMHDHRRRWQQNPDPKSVERS